MHSKRTALLAVVGVLVIGCTEEAVDPAAEPAATPTSPAERDYWPTDDWRIGDAAEHGFDEEELAELDDLVRRAVSLVENVFVPAAED
jgi:hypothetical protein